MRAKHEEEKAKWVKDMSHEREQLSAKHDESLENLRVKLEQRIANNVSSFFKPHCVSNIVLIFDFALGNRTQD